MHSFALLYEWICNCGFKNSNQTLTNIQKWTSLNNSKGPNVFRIYLLQLIVELKLFYASNIFSYKMKYMKTSRKEIQYREYFLVLLIFYLLYAGVFGKRLERIFGGKWGWKLEFMVENQQLHRRSYKITFSMAGLFLFALVQLFPQLVFSLRIIFRKVQRYAERTIWLGTWGAWRVYMVQYMILGKFRWIRYFHKICPLFIRQYIIFVTKQVQYKMKTPIEHH